MANPTVTYVFHISRSKGSPLLLHPFVSPSRLMETLSRGRVEGRYGAEPRVETLTMLRNELYRLVDGAVETWIGELRFIPRFLLSAGVFLLAYFVASYFIRDPIPLVDELIIGFGAAVVAYVWIGKRYGKSAEASRKRIELRDAVDRITFTESPFLVRVESVLHEAERQETEAIRGIVSPLGHDLESAEREEAEQLVGMLESRFDIRRLRREERVLRRFVEQGEPETRAPSIRRWMDLHKLDAPLYALYKGWKKTVQSGRS